MPILANHTDGALRVVELAAGFFRFARGDERAEADCVAELEVRVDSEARGVCDIAPDNAFDAVRTKHDVCFRGRAILEVDDHALAGRVFGEVRATLLEMCACGVDVLDQSVHKHCTVDAVEDLQVAAVLQNIKMRCGREDVGHGYRRRKALRGHPCPNGT